MDIDPQFKRARDRARRRSLKRYSVRIGSIVALLAFGIVAGQWLLTRAPSENGGEQAATGESDGEALVQVEATSVQSIVAAAAPFIDIPGDPMILRLEADGGGGQAFAGPSGLDTSRVGPPAPGRLLLVEDTLVARETRLLTVLPSSREDFALFQARQSLGLEETDALPVFAASGEAPEVADQSEAFGAVLESGVDEGVNFTRTAVQNTTSVVRLLSGDRRRKLYEDIVVVLRTPRTFQDVLTSNGVSEADATLVDRGATRYLPELSNLSAGSVIALRVRPDPSGATPVQISLYDRERYVGTVAQTGSGRFSRSADPWFDVDLLALARETVGVPDTGERKYRLLDTVYSAAIRQGLPTAMVGELIVMMSRAHDLDGFASPQDRFRLLYAPGTSAQGAGSLLFAEVKGPSGTMSCYVVPDREAGSFKCFDPRGRQAGSFGGGMVLPVSGWPVSSPFGPRRHPILKTVRNHAGVDWAAPIGTPVKAAAAGKVVTARDAGAYGNLVIIDHGDGVETRYAHLHSFAVKAGTQVAAGEAIGTVGSTGLSTGPHLHFEIRVGGKAVDPMTYGGSAGAGLTASAAVEELTDRIIRVESAGVADARNPLSTATGLGQFIESTWLRMIQTYRPDLYSSMSRADILALRTNPALSREMVKNLARESEAYLRARGHSVTAGRLYLAHFLGAEGADTALRAADTQSVAEVMGRTVVSANPFLRGYTIADLKAWADRKMGNRGAVVSAPVTIPPEIAAFIAVVDEALAEAG